MKKLSLLIFTIIFSSLLVGCGDKLNQIKEAASGIDEQADKAAKAISLDAHSIRSIEINYENNSFTINELFKTILRDTQWEYEQNGSNHTLIVKGTWKEPLFENYNLAVNKDQLREKGKVMINLQFENGKLIEEKTKVLLQMDDKKLLEEEGKEILLKFYNIYINTTGNN